MRSYVLGLLTLAGSLQAITIPLSYGTLDKDEAFLVRRIAEFWKDQDYKLVQVQITDFLAKYPKSKISDHLRGVLADLYLQEKKYEEAVVVYNDIRAWDTLEQIAINKLQCYYELGKFDKMIDFGKGYLGKTDGEFDTRSDELYFLMAEAYFREAQSTTDPYQKMELLAKAMPLYEKIIKSTFNDPAMFALAEIYHTNKEYQKAAGFFLELSERHSEQREDLLFHVALAEAEFDKKLAIDTFSKVIEKGGPKAKEAEVNRLILHFQSGNFKAVVDAYPKIIQFVTLEQQSSLNYIIGRSHFALQDYTSSSEWLAKFLTVVEAGSPQLKNALLMQLECSQYLKSEEKYQQAMNTLQQYFPEDSELPQAHFIHAIMLKEAGKFYEAEQKLEALITQQMLVEDQEALLLEYSLITYNNENWERCHDTLATLLQEFPDSEHAKVAWKYFLSSSFNLLKKNEADKNDRYTRQHFLEDLGHVLSVEGVLTPSEEKECRFLQGKTAYELGLYKDALTYLNNYLVLYHNDPTVEEAHLFVALCHHNLKDGPDLFCRHAEVALKNSPQLNNKSSIHLELYNVYLSLIDDLEKHDSSKKDELNLFYDLAAEHLHAAINLKDLQIQLENKLWLANYYLQKLVKHPKMYEIDGNVPSENDFLYRRSKSLLENVLVNDSTFHLNSIEADHVYLEWDVMKLANCMGKEKQYAKKIALLRDLAEFQSEHPSWDWKLQKEVLIELAKTYELIGQKQNAYETFQFIALHHKHPPSFASEYASLHSSRLKFEMLKPHERTDNNPEVLAILNELKELQIRKNPATEPLHLEAAYEYAWIRAQMTSEGERTKKYLFFLNRIKEDFSNLEDPIAANYQQVLKANSEKLTLYNAYTKFLELEIAKCQGKKEGLEQKFNEILKTNSSHYLQLRTQQNLCAFKK